MKPHRKFEYVNVITTNNSLAKESQNLQANDILDMPQKKPNCLYDDSNKVVATKPKKKLSCLSQPFDNNSQFNYIPFASRMVQIKEYEVEDNGHVDMKIYPQLRVQERMLCNKIFQV